MLHLCLRRLHLLDILALDIDISLWSLAASCVVVLGDDKSRALAVVRIEILQIAVCCLGIEGPDDGQNASIRGGPDDVELPGKVLDADGCDFDNNEVGDPVRHGSSGSTLGAHREGVDFRCV